MKISGLYMAAVTALTATLMFATPAVAWADEVKNDAVVVTNIEISAEKAVKNAVDEAIESVMDDVMEDAEIVNGVARRNLVDYALQFVGGKYRTGGNDPHTGADCSGFVKYVMKHGAGIDMNRSSRSQATQGTAISAEEIQPGDLIFYGNGSSINHVAMYIGDGKIVHASTHKTGIKVSNWNYRSPVKIISMMG